MTSLLTPHAHCNFCGHRYDAEAVSKWPRYCADCTSTTWKNPIPVLVVLVPLNGGLLAVRRAIPPAEGQLALPGGYMEHGESWQQAAVRELLEETSIQLSPVFVDLLDLRMSHGGNLLIFCQTSPLKINESVIRDFKPNPEVSELVILREPTELAFPTHTEMANLFWSKRSS